MCTPFWPTKPEMDEMLKMAPPPAPLILSATCWPSSSRSATTTLAPSRPKMSASLWPMPLAAPLTSATFPLSLISLPPRQLERLDVDAGRARRVRHVVAHRGRHRDGVALGIPGRALRDLGMLELVERHVRRRADLRAIAAAADDTRHLLVVRHVDRAVPLVPLGIDGG